MKMVHDRLVEPIGEQHQETLPAIHLDDRPGKDAVITPDPSWIADSRRIACQDRRKTLFCGQGKTRYAIRGRLGAEPGRQRQRGLKQCRTRHIAGQYPLFGTWSEATRKAGESQQRGPLSGCC